MAWEVPNINIAAMGQLAGNRVAGLFGDFQQGREFGQEQQAGDAYAPLVSAVYGGGSGQGQATLAGSSGGRPGQIDRQAVMGLLQNPATRQQGVELLLNGGRLPQPKSNLPSDLQEYQYAQGQGFKGSFLDYQTQLKQAGRSSTSVTVNNAGENEFQKVFGRGQAERYNTMISTGDQANGLLGDVQALRELGTQIETGKGAQAIASLGPYAEALGIKIDGLPAAQAYEAVVARMAPRLRVPGSGAQSDFELQQFMKSLPSLGNTPEGNAVIANTMEGIAKNQRQAADIARRAGTNEMTRQQADKALQALPDPFTAWRGARQSMPPRPAPAPATPQTAAPPAGVDPNLWQHMTPEERKLWNSL